MPRYVFITGGVVSSLGKGLMAASLGALLQARGYRVRIRKLDPYLNVDPGTMSPYEHGEVFVTDDGAETDLDIGHYERFTGVTATRTDSVSSGQIYSRVLEKERLGEYLGSTIQVIPHVTNEIKAFIAHDTGDADFVLCEIGGTVGDIEGLPFFEAIRQFALEMSTGSCVFIHLTLIPFLEACGELKTKPTQHSVKELRSIGIVPDMIVCRSDMPLPEKERRKIALFCNVRQDAVVSSQTMESIYYAPIAYHEEGLDTVLLQSFGITDAREPDMSDWRDVWFRINNTIGSVRVAVVGKYTALEDSYKSISEALIHGGIANRVRVEAEFIESDIFESSDPGLHLQGCDAILVPGGFGGRGIEGKIKAAEYARLERIPYLGICLGMQTAIIDAARNLLGIANAGSEEFVMESEDSCIDIEPIIFYLQKWQQGSETIERTPGDSKGATMRLGSYQAVLDPNSLAYRQYDCREISERHRHRFEVDVAYREKLQEKGVVFSGMSPDGTLPEIMELRNHPWFIGVQFHPELKSRPLDPH
ncbi:MAG: CTP synthase, partial [Rhodobacteraceae bacterium]|nr:CTP synthase [Paracoccaceae bacterium]